VIAACGVSYGVRSKRSAARFMVPPLVENVIASATLYRAVRANVAASPYDEYARLSLGGRPDVHLFVVESYGVVLEDHPAVSGAYRALLAEMEADLAGGGWAAVSGFSEPPISGSRSWLSDGSLLTGLYIPYESLYRHIVREDRPTPSLVRFLQGQGYHAALLAPVNRARPGVRLLNEYGFDRTIYFDDLDYRGPPIGWGRIPDGYSLAYAHERYFAPVEAPLFTTFFMVSSHAPWEEQPPSLSDWRDYAAIEADAEPLVPDRAAEDEILKRLRRYKRGQGKKAYMGRLEAFQIESFLDLIAYDLALIRDYILDSADPDALVIVLGDHQPPVLSEHIEGFHVPVHFISRDPQLLRALETYGLRPGLAATEGALARSLRHEGVFSLLARELARRHGGLGEADLPPWLPEGAPLSE